MGLPAASWLHADMPGCEHSTHSGTLPAPLHLWHHDGPGRCALPFYRPCVRRRCTAFAPQAPMCAGVCLALPYTCVLIYLKQLSLMP